jgi:uncharacterized protein
MGKILVCAYRANRIYRCDCINHAAHVAQNVLRMLTFSGYASFFNSVDMCNDIVIKGAFQKSLNKRGTKGIRMLFQHDPYLVIGYWLEIHEDAKGLFVKGRIHEDDRLRDIVEAVESRSLKGLSIGFKTIIQKVEPSTKIRQLHEVDLWEISIVAFPMLAEAGIEETNLQQTHLYNSLI